MRSASAVVGSDQYQGRGDVSSAVKITSDPSLLLLLAQCERALFAALRSTSDAEGVSPEQWRIVGALREHEVLPMTELAQIAALPAASLTRNLDRLVSSGAVVRQIDPFDRRKVVALLTKPGAELAARLHLAEARLLAQLPQADTRAVRALAEVLAATVSASIK